MNMQKPTASYWIEKLQLQKHIEGGSFREVYRSSLIIEKNNLPDIFNGSRNSSTSIYFLLENGQFSALHRIASDELWHFYYGDGLTIYQINALSGELHIKKLGSNIENGEVFNIAS